MLRKYHAYVKYSATNVFGGRVDNTVIVFLDDDLEDFLVLLGMITGTHMNLLESIDRWRYYQDLASPEIIIDADRIMANI